MTDMRPAWILLAALIALLALGWWVSDARGASLADPNDYLAKHGLSAPLVPFHLVPLTEQEGTPLHALGGGPDWGWASPTGTAIPVEACVIDDTPPSELCPQGGRHEQPGVWVSGDLPPLDRAHVALHEWGHVVSFNAAWQEIDCYETPAYCRRDFTLWYEEGVVEAWAMAHLPGWWKAISGKPLRRQTILMRRAEPGYEEARFWLRAAERATGTNRWSRESREWLNGALQMPLDERVTGAVVRLRAPHHSPDALDVHLSHAGDLADPHTPAVGLDDGRVSEGTDRLFVSPLGAVALGQPGQAHLDCAGHLLEVERDAVAVRVGLTDGPVEAPWGAEVSGPGADGVRLVQLVDDVAQGGVHRASPSLFVGRAYTLAVGTVNTLRGLT